MSMPAPSAVSRPMMLSGALPGFDVLLRRSAVVIAAMLQCLLPAMGASSTALPSVSRPNIVVILCDDLGYGDLGVHGHPWIQTPNIDALANTGIRFSSFYSAAPVCSPSRVGLLTGRSPNRAGVYDWIPPADGDKPVVRKDARERVHLQRHEITLPQLMQQAGYATCMAGKWHCNSQFNHPAQPQPGDAGFDHWLATQNNAAPSHQNPTNYVRNGQPIGRQEGFSCQIATTEAITWLQQHTSSQPETPFFVYLPFHEPHEPVASPEDLVQRYLPVAQNEDQAQYFANVHNVDLAVGRLVKALAELNVRQQTLIVFTADNGPETLNRYRSASRSWGVTGPLRGMKLHTHDGGFHVAGIMNWPAVMASGRVVDQPVSALDLLPTFCDLAGVALPSNRPLDGISLTPLLHNEPVPHRAQPLVWAYYNAINEARVAMRHEQWKVLARLNGGQLPRMENLTNETLQAVRSATLTDFEIYNLERDPGETLNLFNREAMDPAKQQNLLALLQARYTELAGDSPAWDQPGSPAQRDRKN